MTKRLATATALEPTETLRISTEALVTLLATEPLEGARILERFTGMIQREFTVPELLAKVRRVSGALTEEMSSLSLTMYRASLWLKSPRPYLHVHRLRAVPRLLVSRGRGAGSCRASARCPGSPRW